jgi:hypothetical protein
MDGFERNSRIHNILIDFAEKLFLRKQFPKALELISGIAFYETKFYYGYLSSIRLEKLLIKIGKTIFPDSNYKKKDTDQQKVLHIASEFYNIGGHTRVILDWIKYDSEYQSEIIVTDQKQDFDLSISSKVTFLAEGNNIEKARLLRDYITENYFDVIIIHQNMDDVIPTIALWDIKEHSSIRVYYYNHADFRFSLGNIIAHKRINFCKGDELISEKYRIPIENCVLPFVLGNQFEPDLPNPEKEQLKQKLKIEGKTIFLTIGSAYKYRPYQKLNFLMEWNSFLQKNSNCTLLVIGCNDEDFKKYCPDSVCHKNLLLLGNINDPSVYYKISNYIVDIYPLQTGLGTVYGLIYNLPPILPYSDNPYVMGNELNTLYPKELLQLLTYNDKNSYFEFIKNELNTQHFKINSQPIIKSFVSNNLLAKSWRNKLYEIYNSKLQKELEIQENKDVLNTSTASNNWYNYNNSLIANFALILLYFRQKGPFNLRIIYYYFSLSLKHKKIIAGKLFFSYLFKR